MHANAQTQMSEYLSTLPCNHQYSNWILLTEVYNH